MVYVCMGVAWVIDSVSMILHLILLEAEYILVRPAPEEPSLAVEVGDPLARPDRAVVVGDGGAITPHRVIDVNISPEILIFIHLIQPSGRSTVSPPVASRFTFNTQARMVPMGTSGSGMLAEEHIRLHCVFKI